MDNKIGMDRERLIIDDKEWQSFKLPCFSFPIRARSSRLGRASSFLFSFEVINKKHAKKLIG
eukprot:6674845-Ditylum_brightwellii.AAC.1